MITSLFSMLLLVCTSFFCCCKPSHGPSYRGYPNVYYHQGGYYYVVPHGSPYNPVYHPPVTLPVPASPAKLPDKVAPKVPDKATPKVPDKVAPKTPVTKDKTLYERLGGEAAIKAVVDDFVGRAAANPKVNFFRKGTDKERKPTPADVDRLKKLLVDQIGSATGGPQKYTGRNMLETHKGMKITEAEFAAIAGDLKATLDKFKVPAKEQDELMKIVGSTAPDIVEPKKK